VAPAPVQGTAGDTICSWIQAFASVIPVRGFAGALGQAKAVRAVREHVHGVGNVAGRECRGEAIGVFRRDVGVYAVCQTKVGGNWAVTSESSDVDRRSCGLAFSPRRRRRNPQKPGMSERG
jgi:hypothetical protein